jgi:DNA-binding LacI/PurR family transcriptional regulator
VVRQEHSGLTMEEVARLAGVSKSTVSRVINGSPFVSATARAAVERVIAETDYVPSMAARNLAQQHSNSIAVIIPDTANRRLFADPFFPTLLSGISAGLRQHDLQLVLLRPETQRDFEHAQSFIGAHHVEGAMLVGLDPDNLLGVRLLRRGVPLVVVGTAPDPAISSVDCDNHEGGRMATAHLISIGRRRIGTIDGPLYAIAAGERLAGYRAALREAGLEVDPKLEAEGDYSSESGVLGVKELLARVPDLDGLFVANDLMAASALRALQDAGRKIPDDVAIVGFDDSAIARMTRPQLSSISQPIERMGREMADLLVGLITEGPRLTRHIVFETSLVVRESSRPTAP